MLDVLLNVASFAGGALIAVWIARHDSRRLRQVAEALRSHNELVASETRQEFKRSMRAAGIRIPPPSEEAIEVEFNGGGDPRYNWPKETWRVKQGDWSAYTDDWPTMLELVRYLTYEVEASYPPDEAEWNVVKTGSIKLTLEPEEFWKGVHILDEGS